ncbi:MAG TPA: XRE family transcriptional regulator [Candidatus Kapabacteria bacterium]|jgi:predicted XRE-type DNA-binding protein|nr:XRE family transcriptional regulator [Candidatus Kapabacteria bacterium]
MTKQNVTRSSGNVFEDLGFAPEEAHHLRLRASLMTELRREITKRGWTQRAAAESLGVSQPRISDLMRGKIHLFSIDSLVDMLAVVGRRVRLVIGRSAQM